MKRLLQFVAVAAVTFLMPAAVSMPAYAAFTCKVGYTGPDSNNMCTSEVDYDCEVNNDTNVTITNTTNQDTFSGDVEVSGNGSGGNGTSGTVSNTSGTTFNVVINNGASDTDPDTCVAKAVVPAEETPETPEEPEKPAEEVEKPRALPVTSGEVPTVLSVLGGGAVVLGAMFMYRRLHL